MAARRHSALSAGFALAVLVLVLAVSVSTVAAAIAALETCDALSGTVAPSCNVCVADQRACSKACRPAQQDAVAAWLLTETAGDVAHDAVGTLSLLRQGTTTWLPGAGARFDDSVAFSGFSSDDAGSADFLRQVFFDSKQMTIEIWTLPTIVQRTASDRRMFAWAKGTTDGSLTQNQNIVVIQGSALVDPELAANSRLLQSRLRQGTTTTSSPGVGPYFANDTRPVHVVITHHVVGDDTINSVAYKNGVEVSLRAMSLNVPFASADYFVSDTSVSIGGQRPHTGGAVVREFDGDIFAVVLYDRVLTPAQVSELYQLGHDAAAPCNELEPKSSPDLVTILLIIAGSLLGIAAIAGAVHVVGRRRGQIGSSAFETSPFSKSTAAAAAPAAVASVAVARSASPLRRQRSGTAPGPDGRSAPRRKRSAVKRGAAPPSVPDLGAVHDGVGTTYTSVPLRSIVPKDQLKASRRSSMDTQATTATQQSINSAQAPFFHRI